MGISCLDNLFDGWSFAFWLKELYKISLITLIAIIVVLVAAFCIFNVCRKGGVSNILVVHQNGGDETGKLHKYDCLAKDFENIETISEMEGISLTSLSCSGSALNIPGQEKEFVYMN